MRTAFQEEEEEELAEAGHSPGYDYDRHTGRELNLSSTTLLAIFFGLVLVCGLCFGLGYTLGRRATADTADSVSTVQASSLPVSSQPKPSAAAPFKPADPVPPPVYPQNDSQNDVQPAGSKPDDAIPEPTQVQATVKPTMQTAALDQSQRATVKPAMPAVATAPTPQSAPAGIMVQIAAVSNPADAAALVTALRKHGYSAVVRHEPADTLNHVQTGPFASRAEAIAMKQKLLADGYNAILK